MNLAFIFFWLFAGALGGVMLIFVARKKAKKEIKILAGGLFIVALIYLLLSLITAPMRWVILDLAGVLLYGTFAWLALRHHVQWLGLGWLLHAGWDILHHASYVIPDVSPEWYAVACISFDGVVGVYALFHFAKHSQPRHPVSTR